MCGLVGMIARKQSGFFHTDLDIFENMLLIDQLRGKDSTGVFGIDRNRHVNIMKVASHPNHLFACDDWRKLRQSSISSGRILIGHNRAATKGEVSTNNAHPFHENNIILVHNGTLREDHKKKHADREVDSHAICAAFNEKGAEAVLPTIDGAFALIWWDIAKGTLFVCRNDERPLSMVYTEDAILIASEPWMAQAAATRAHRKVENVIEFEEGHLYELNNKMEFTSKKLTFTNQSGGKVVTTAMQVCGVTRTGMAAGTNTAKEPEPGTKQNLPVLVTDMTAYPKHIDRFPTIDGPFDRNERILMRFNEGQMHTDRESGREFIKFMGSTCEPDRVQVDVIAYMPFLNGTQQLTRHLQVPVTARVLHQSKSACGWSLYANDIQPAAVIQLHNTTMAIREWVHVVANCKCHKCDASVNDLEAEVTSVRTMPNGLYKVTCPDCIQDKLIDGEYKDEFQQARNRALQVGEQLSNQSGGKSEPSVEGPSTPTLH